MPTVIFSLVMSGTSLSLSSQFQPFQSFNRFAPFKSFNAGVQSSTKKQLDRNFQVSGIGEMRDRRRYLHWVFEAKKRFSLSVINYVVTCNHAHLLIRDSGPNVIADSMQLIAGRSGQEYNQRKRRHGAFWEDRYHATAIDADDHLHRCLVYIDLNMVRAGLSCTHLNGHTAVIERFKIRQSAMESLTYGS